MDVSLSCHGGAQAGEKTMRMSPEGRPWTTTGLDDPGGKDQAKSQNVKYKYTIETGSSLVISLT